MEENYNHSGEYFGDLNGRSKSVFGQNSAKGHLLKISNKAVQTDWLVRRVEIDCLFLCLVKTDKSFA